ncbi:MAG: hypothetical protein RQ757_11375, partial [Pseudomonadales bacterium]|nr:hypothetical protein [Pseudomonadales bacterium]
SGFGRCIMPDYGTYSEVPEVFERIQNDLDDNELEVLRDYLDARRFERNNDLRNAIEKYEQVLQKNSSANIPEKYLSANVVDSLIVHYINLELLDEALALSETQLALNPANWKLVRSSYHVASQLYPTDELVSYCEDMIRNGITHFRPYLVATLLSPFQRPSTDGYVDYIDHVTFLRIWTVIAEDVDENPENSSHYLGTGISNLQQGFRGYLEERDLRILMAELQNETQPISTIAAEVLLSDPERREIAEDYLERLQD